MEYDHNPPTMGGYEVSRNVEASAYNVYSMAPPYLGAVSGISMSYGQQSSVTAMGGPTYTYAS